MSVNCLNHIAIEKNLFRRPKMPDIFTYKEQEVICGILVSIPVNSCGDYTLEKDSLEHVKKYMML